MMSFERKWVSDTNLSKLLHETIEKKEANKQSVSPDFCKDAILSATIKKISSVMVLKPRISTTEEKVYIAHDYKEFLSNSDETCEMDSVLSGMNSGKDTFDSGISMHISMEEPINDLGDFAAQNESDFDNVPNTPRQHVNNSPKRKRHPSSEMLETSGHASPSKRKRQVEKFITAQSPRSDCRDRYTVNRDWQANGETSCPDSPFLLHKRGQRSHSLPHLSSILHKEKIVASRTNYSPIKSVVNSISGLSIRDCWEPDTDGSWCLPQQDIVDSDPLELNGFFQELKSAAGSL